MSADPPLCPACDYPLGSIPRVDTCPECGQALSEPIRQYSLSRRRGVWSLSAGQFLAASAQVILKPWVFTEYGRVTVRLVPGLAFAAMWTIAVFALWLPLRQATAFVAHCVVWSPDRALQFLAQTWSRPYTNTAAWPVYAFWIAWAMTGWWLAALIAVVTARLVARSQAGPLAWRRMLLLAPWVFLADHGFMIAARSVGGDTVPEPGSIFVDRLGWTSWLQAPWPARALPLFVFLAVAGVVGGGLRARQALVTALLLTAPLLILMVCWSKLYLLVRS